MIGEGGADTIATYWAHAKADVSFGDLSDIEELGEDCRWVIPIYHHWDGAGMTKNVEVNIASVSSAVVRGPSLDTKLLVLLIPYYLMAGIGYFQPAKTNNNIPARP
jgi:hypothetical protein